MNERDKQFRVGMLVIGTLLISGILVLIFDGVPKIGSERYLLYLRFKDAPGVSDGTPIRKSGIRIGRVQSLKFAEDIPALAAAKETGVVVTVEIDANRTVRQFEVPQIRQTLIGDAFIEFTLDPTKPDNLPAYPRGETIVGVVQTNPLEFISKMEGDLALTMRSVANTSGEIGGLARRISDLLKNNDQQFTRIVAKTELSIDGLQQTIAHVDQLVGDPEVQKSIKAAARELPYAMAELREAVSHLKPSMQKAEEILTDVRGFTRPLGERGPQLIESIDRAAIRMDTVLGELDKFSRSINSADGTIGRLIKDPQLYESLNSVASNVNELTRELKPIVRDARAFSDKISRHPESLGVRGALFPSSGIK